MESSNGPGARAGGTSGTRCQRLFRSAQYNRQNPSPTA
jgi:hypothetical protein